MPQTKPDEFNKNGYWVERNLIPADFILEIKEHTQLLLEDANQNPSDLFSNYLLSHRTDQGVLYDVYQRSPMIRRLIEHPRVTSLLQELYASEFYLFENSLVYKPEDSANEVVWHQDFVYLPDDPVKAIVWIPLEPITVDNGCLEVFSGSHLDGPLEYKNYPGETHGISVGTNHLSNSKRKKVVMDVGDVLVFNQYLVHSSARVSNPAKRFAVRFAICSFEKSYTPRAVPIVLSKLDRDSQMALKSENTKRSLRRRLAAWIVKSARRFAGERYHHSETLP